MTVEGVETSEQVDFVNDGDADQVQGFFFGKPVPAAEIAADVLAEFRKSVALGDSQTPQLISAKA